MFWLTVPQTGALLALATVVLAFLKRRASKSQLPLPPGPPGHWLLGNTIPKKL